MSVCIIFYEFRVCVNHSIIIDLLSIYIYSRKDTLTSVQRDTLSGSINNTELY